MKSLLTSSKPISNLKKKKGSQWVIRYTYLSLKASLSLVGNIECISAKILVPGRLLLYVLLLSIED